MQKLSGQRASNSFLRQAKYVRKYHSQCFIRWVDAEVDLFWESGQNFLFNLSKHTEFYTMSMSISYNDSENNRYARDMHELCERYAQDMPQICPKYTQDIPEIC